MHYLKKGLAVLLSIIMVLSLCGFAEPVVEEEHSHEDETVVVTDAPEAEEPEAEKTEEPEVEEPGAEPETPVVEEPVEEPETEDAETKEPEVEETEEEPETEEPEVDETEAPVVDETEAPVDEQFAATMALLDEAVALSEDSDCEHANTVENLYDMATTQVKSSTSEGHTVVYSRLYRTECSDCWSTIGYRVETEEVTEEHRFSMETWNGRCHICGYVCPHENISWEDAETWYADSFEYVDSNTHKIIEVVRQEARCPDCHVTIERSVGEPKVYEAEHEIEDGHCGCGYVEPSETCAHEHTTAKLSDEIYWGEDAGYREENGECYLEETWVTYSVYCDDCGEWLYDYEEYATDLHLKTKHYFLGGSDVCAQCGYVNACKHENVVTVMDESPWGDAVDNGDGTHTYKIPTKMQEYCVDCGSVLSAEYVDKYAVRAHTFDGNDGEVCDSCGAPNENWSMCTHPNAEECVEMKTYTSAGDYVDNNVHSVSVQKYEETYTVCPDCGLREFKSSEPVGSRYTAELPHEPDDFGWCWVCSADVEMPVCHHDEEYVLWYYDTDWHYLLENRDEEGHEAVCFDWKEAYCTNCGEYFGYEEGLEYATYLHHVWDENGVCRDCGYVNTCKHEHAEKWTGTEEEIYSAFAVDESEHAWRVRKVQFLECPDCGYYEETFLGYEDELVHSSHMIVNGSCALCGFIPECSHLNAVVYRVDGEPWYESINEKNHILHNQSMVYSVCPDCGVRIIIEDIDDMKLEAHVFDEEGYCECGESVGVPCEHPSDYITAIEVDGARETRYTPVNGDDTVHSVEIWTQYQKRCNACGEFISEPLDPEPVRTLMPRTLPHTFKDGVCTFCGFKQTCTHPNATSEVGEPVFDRYETTAAEHVKVSKVTTTTTCPDCGYVTTKTEEVKAEAEPHTWENGACTTCKYECQHPDDQRKYGEATTETGYAAEDDAAHVPTTTTTTPYACGLCGKADEKVEVVKGDAEKHTYVKSEDGAYICEVCEHECSHANATSDAVTEFDRYEITADEHVKVSKVTTTTTCPDCGSVTVEAQEVSDEAEAHAWKDGVCTVCDYECLHETTSDEVIHEILDYEEIDDEYHYELGNEIVETSCDVCGKVTNTTEPVDWKSEPIEHSYADGVCIECGHTCTHVDREVEEDVFVVKSCAPVDGAEHAVTGDIHHVTSCALCGTVLSDEVTQQNVVVNEKHVFSGRKCTLCGYTKPVKQDETPVVEDEQIFREVPADEVVHGISAADKLRMAVALVRAMRGIEAEYGDDVEISIVNAEMILTAAELEKLNALRPEERILVLLSVIDYQNEVNVATAALEIQLGDEAQALVDEIAARIEAMDTDARAEFDANLKAAYPVVQVEADGIVADQTEVIIELKFREDNTYRLERYTFRCDNGSWYFISLAN